VLPYRIDLFDDEIESIRSFDMDTQRSLYPVNEVELLPGREFPMDETARNHFRSRFRDLFEGDPSRAMPYKDMGNGIAFAGIEYYLPLFFDDTATLFDYLRPETITVTVGAVEEAIRQFHDDTQSRYRFLKSDRERPVLAPEHLFLSEEQFFVHLKSFARLHLDETSPNAQFAPAPDIAVLRRSDDPFARLRAWLNRGEQRLLLCADSAGRRETLLQLLREQQLEPSAAFDNVQDFVASDIDFGIAIAPLNTGFIIRDRQLCLVTENDLYPGSASVAQRRRRKQERSSNVDAMVRDLSELREGDPVVHMQYGIGRYHGLVTMDLGEGDIELLHLQYSGNSTLYVPVSQLHVISRYSGADPEHAPLHQLGSGQWDRARKKAAKQIRDAAAELLALYALRAAREGFSFKLPFSDYQTFVEGFGFEETVDQQAAIDAVIGDMTSGKPMDRLVCGDVGFGKTEVALRAAFLCVANGKQVALLCPTTLLAEQHAQTFADRFADWPVRVAELSRFRSTKEVKAS
ncbi:MAG: CarD family transcriptional regulator, partial [Alphaproteobacteria bacterium]